MTIQSCQIKCFKVKDCEFLQGVGNGSFTSIERKKIDLDPERTDMPLFIEFNDFEEFDADSVKILVHSGYDTVIGVYNISVMGRISAVKEETRAVKEEDNDTNEEVDQVYGPSNFNSSFKVLPRKKPTVQNIRQEDEQDGLSLYSSSWGPNGGESDESDDEDTYGNHSANGQAKIYFDRFEK